MAAKRIGVLLSAALVCASQMACAQDAKTFAAAPRHKTPIVEASGTTLDAGVAHLAGSAAFGSRAQVSQQQLFGVLLLLSMHQAKARGA